MTFCLYNNFGYTYFFGNKVFGGGVLKFNEKSTSVIIGVVIMMHEKKCESEGNE